MALQWLVANAADLGVQPARIAIMGDSGGGGIAASLAIYARDHGGPAIAKQILIYPMLDDRNTTPDPDLTPFAPWTYDDNITLFGTGTADGLNRDYVMAFFPAADLHYEAAHTHFGVGYRFAAEPRAPDAPLEDLATAPSADEPAHSLVVR